MIRIFFKKHSILLMAMGTLLAVAAYEAYWLYGLYHTQRQALVTQISSLLTEAEANEFREQFNKSLSTDSTSVYLSSFTSRPAVITISKDTLSGKPKEISVHRLNDAPKEVKRFVAGDFDIRRVDELFTQSLDSIGLSLPHYLRFLRDSTAIDSVGTAGYHPAGNAPVIPVTSHLNQGIYELRSPSLTAYILRGMWGTLAVSAGILLLVVAAFGFTGRVLRQQRDLERMKNDFTGNITHELKTPIAVAYAANDALLNFGADADGTKRTRYLRICQEQLTRLGGLVEQILSLSMERRHNFRLHRTTFPVADILAPLIEQHKLKADKPVRISTRLTPPGLEVNADRTHFSNIVSNLLDNAIKYSAGQAEVEIEARQEGGAFILSVRDKGTGIPKDKLAHVFDKFYRVPTGNLHPVKGYGLGLYYVKTMVERHGGTVEVESEPGRGSEFIIKLRMENEE